MLGLNGLELLKKVKSSNSNVRTILMSAYNFEDELFQNKYGKSKKLSRQKIIHLQMKFSSHRNRENLPAVHG